MIISVSRRTDIPAFYSDWFFNRLQDGFVLVRNPMNPHQVSKVSLSKEVVDCFVFWTKNPRSMLEKLSLLSGYDYYFHFTLNPYGKEIEVNLPPKAELIETFIELSDRIGKHRVIWRYDPIFLAENVTLDYHFEQFRALASHLKGYTRKCIISFLNMYKKTARNLAYAYGKVKNAGCLTEEQIRGLAKGFAQTAKEFNLVIETCAEKVDLADLGISPGKCIDDRLIAEITGAKLNLKKDKNQRKECGCVAGIDIGAYNTCLHNCLYCYANLSPKKVMENMKRHDKTAPLLFGRVTEEDLVAERKMFSCKRLQAELF